MPPTGESEALPPAQREVRARCRHPSGDFVPFDEAWVNGSLVSGFERHATAGPGRVAIRSPTCTLTFGDVEVLAARLAAALIGSRGDNSEPVALVFGHDAPIVAAMFGTLRAGKFYVPIDPSYPADRLRYMLDDARAAVVVCSRAHLPLARELAGRTRGVLCLDALEDASDARAVPRPALAPDRPALLLYTSGSTGRPKGFVQTHGNVLHDVMQYTNAAHFSPDDRFLLVSSFSFADSIRTIYSSLLNGARLLPFDLRRYGMPALADWLVDERITVYRSVPTVFRHFARTLGGTEIFDDLRLIYLAGEPVVRRDVELFRRHFPETCFLVNRIGTGEALTFASYFLDRHTAVHGPSVPVGYPVPGKDVLLLDESGREIEGRGIGEMVIRSRFLSPGYWHRPDLTDAAFSTVPGEPGLRTYRTGDLCERLADGALVHLGRRDLQVKIRGHRVETAEIEMALAEHPAVGDAVVVARPDEDGDLRLVAYLTLAGASVPSTADLRRFLATTLPDPMLPWAYEVLDSLPLTASGKVDRRSLPNPGDRPLDATPVDDAPAAGLESALAEIWREVLGLECIGRHEHFLDLGGDSLSAMRVTAQVAKRFGTTLSVPDLLNAATVAEMARVVASHVATSARPAPRARARRARTDRSRSGRP